MSSETKTTILDLVRQYHKERTSGTEFRPGVTPILPSGAALNDDDRVAIVEAALELRIAAGVSSRQFERQFARKLGLRKAHLTNSGSSANLLALAALCAPELEDERLKPGDEVITVAAGFPTTVNPILQNGLVPVYVDVDPHTHNVDVDALREAVGPRTRAVMLAHTLGNPWDVDAVLDVAREHDLWVVEDCCDALGSTYDGRRCGTFGDIATLSFYPAHHITTGEGGCVLTNVGRLKVLVESFRDWGRDCWCEPGDQNTCGKRFNWQLGDLPRGYDHKYIYSHRGYNLKITDMQAAIGVAQLDKLPGFIEARKDNWRRLRDGMDRFSDVLVLPEPTPKSDPSWFGFALQVRPDAPFSRGDLVGFLQDRKIDTRELFGGNLMRQPAYRNAPHRVPGSLEQTDRVMNGSFWIGCYPGLTDEMIDYVIDTFGQFLRLRAVA